MTDSARPGLIYLIHFDDLVGRARHYVGYTRKDRLTRRMQEHRGEYAAGLTARAARKGVGFTLVATWEAADTSDERRFKKRGNFAKRCPLCTGQDDIEGTRIHYSARQTGPPTVDWQSVRWANPP